MAVLGIVVIKQPRPAFGGAGNMGLVSILRASVDLFAQGGCTYLLALFFRIQHRVHFVAPACREFLVRL